MVERLRRKVRVYPDPVAAGRAVAERVVELSDAAVRQRGRFAVAISGGHTPEPLFHALAGLPEGPERWPRWQLFFCDEREVPPDDPRSNLGLARRLWLGPAAFPEGNVHPVDTAAPAEEAARRYELELRGFFDRPGPATFDAVVLGVGPDGHTASLFPGSAAVEVNDRWVAAEPHPSQPPIVPRVTMTLEGLGHARTAILLVCGSDKRAALTRILSSPAAGSRGPDLPAARLTALDTVEWYLDRDASPSGT